MRFSTVASRRPRGCIHACVRDQIVRLETLLANSQFISPVIKLPHAAIILDKINSG
jgi:hypothetical protein